VTQFDYLALTVILISALVGWMRGAAREMVTVVAFVLAAAIALFGLRYTAGVARQLIHPAWAAQVVAVAVVFLIVYIALRIFGAGLAGKIQATNVLGALDRSVGLGFGLIRALVILGAFNLVFNAATPPDRVPRWISHGALYPMTTAAARILKTFAPKGMGVAVRLKPAFVDDERDKAPDEGYDAAERNRVDQLVEKSR
jgi:membrane protein required for colicin V production